MYRMKQMAAMLRKNKLDIKYHCYYNQMESLTYIPKRTHLNDILCNVVVISILLNRVLQTLRNMGYVKINSLYHAIL